MTMRKVALIFLFILFFTFPAHGATVYKWVDKDGVVNFTDDKEKIPQAYRGRIEVRMEMEVAGERSAAEASGRGREEKKVGPYGGDSAWQQDTIRRWKEKLKEATADYARTEEKLVKTAELLVQSRYAGKTQYQIVSVELAALSEQLEGYRAEIAEANFVLNKYSKEGKEDLSASDEQILARVETNNLSGYDEARLKETLQPWREQLNEASEKYAHARNKFVSEAEKLGPFRWGGLSLTQYQMISSKLVLLDAQMAKYRDQMTEASQRLRRFSREPQ
jgi:hypothetical protein